MQQVKRKRRGRQDSKRMPTHSRTLEVSGRREIGWYLGSEAGSRLGFLSMVETTACLNTQCEKEVDVKTKRNNSESDGSQERVGLRQQEERLDKDNWLVNSIMEWGGGKEEILEGGLCQQHTGDIESHGI